MSLTLAQLAARDGRVTASRVACLMTGDGEKILRLWREMTGQAESEDLSHVWPVRLGEATEALNLAWYEYKTGHALTRQGEVVVHPKCDWAAATLDGWDDALPAPVECKCVGGFEARATVIARYMPQLHWQMIVTGQRQIVLSIIEGGKEPVLEHIVYDDDYAAELWRRAEAFMACVRDLVAPVALAPVAAPVPAVREVDMETSNAWTVEADYWLANRQSAKAFESAAKEIKALVPADVKRAFGRGIVAERNRAGAISIKEMTS